MIRTIQDDLISLYWDVGVWLCSRDGHSCEEVTCLVWVGLHGWCVRGYLSNVGGVTCLMWACYPSDVGIVTCMKRAELPICWGRSYLSDMSMFPVWRGRSYPSEGGGVFLIEERRKRSAGQRTTRLPQTDLMMGTNRNRSIDQTLCKCILWIKLFDISIKTHHSEKKVVVFLKRIPNFRDKLNISRESDGMRKTLHENLLFHVVIF